MTQLREVVKLLRDLLVILFGTCVILEYAGVHLFGAS